MMILYIQLISLFNIKFLGYLVQLHVELVQLQAFLFYAVHVLLVHLFVLLYFLCESQVLLD
jgi:hypothetical protein